MVTSIEAVVAPVDHRNVPLLLAVNVMDGVAQVSTVVASEIDAPGTALSKVMSTLAVDVQPLVPVTVTL